jgi:hypothetical protein
MIDLKTLIKKYLVVILTGINVLQGILFILGLFSLASIVAEPGWIFMIINIVLFCCNITLSIKIISNTKSGRAGRTIITFNILIPFIAGLELGCFYMDGHLFDFFIQSLSNSLDYEIFTY